MHQLLHNGILIPEYKPSEEALQILCKERSYGLHPSEEEMAVAWARKLDTPYVQDPIFKQNFFHDFIETLKWTNVSPEDFNFSEIKEVLDREKQAKLNWSPEQKKADRLQRKAFEQNKLRYGYAIVDGVKTEIANYRAEPAGIFMGRGAHPKRGSWKAAVSAEEVSLNLSPDAPMPAGFVNRVWEPSKCYVAKWRDKFSGKIKYIFFADSSVIRQSGDIEKYDKAVALLKNFDKVSTLIEKNLTAKDKQRRQIATCCWLIENLGLRVGDESNPDEAETIGSTTLKKEHLSFSKDGRILTLDFLGKDSVHYQNSINVTAQVETNLKEFCTNPDGKLFGDITSTDVNNFLSEAMPSLTAKVFRTALGTSLLQSFLNKHTPKDISGIAEYVKVLTAKYANLEAAKFLNHRRALPKNFEQSLKKKEEKLHHLLAEKKYEAADKLKAEIDFQAKAGNYSLNTSLRSYLDPRIFMTWCKTVELDPKIVYSKTLLSKFSWSMEK